MAELNQRQTAWLRSEVGDKPTATDLNEAYERLGSVRDVAIEILRRRRANLLDAPLSTTLQGVAGVNYTENVKALERRIAALQQLDTDPSDTPGEPVDGGGAEPVVVMRLTRTRGR